MTLRAASRQRRGNMFDARLDVIDIDFLRHRLDEAHTTSIEEIGKSTLIDDKDATSSIVGCIIVQPNGSWEDPLTINGAQRRWSAYLKFIGFFYDAPSERAGAEGRISVHRKFGDRMGHRGIVLVGVLLVCLFVWSIWFLWFGRATKPLAGTSLATHLETRPTPATHLGATQRPTQRPIPVTDVASSMPLIAF